MGEVARHFPLTQHAARGTVHLGRGHAGTNCPNRSLLRFQYGLVQQSSFRRRPSNIHSSRAVRTIIGEYNTKIAHHEPAPGIRARDARPCTIAERGPEASMVAKDMPSA